MIEAAVTTLLATKEGKQRLLEVWTGAPFTDVLRSVQGGSLTLRPAYRSVLENVAKTLRLPPDLFHGAPLAQHDAAWPEAGALVLLLRGHCDLYDQSLSRRRAGQVGDRTTVGAS